MGITNYLKNDVMKEYFHENVFVKTFEILLKEKVQVKADIDMKISKYKKYNYEKEVIENDIRSFSYISDMPEVSALSKHISSTSYKEGDNTKTSGELSKFVSDTKTTNLNLNENIKLKKIKSKT